MIEWEREVGDFFSSEERMIQMIKIYHGSLLAGSWGREHLNERKRMGEFFLRITCFRM